jgi:uncharacterized protein
VIQALLKPGRDPREDLPPPIFKKGILRLEDLQPGMELKGTVLNVVDFGAFVDIGLKDSGLVHISQLANRYIKSPYEVVAVNDVVSVWVLTVDMERRRVSLTMIAPGTERKPPERRPRRPEGARPPRGRRFDGPPGQGQQGPHDQQGQPAQQGAPRHGGPGEGRGPRPPRGRPGHGQQRHGQGRGPGQPHHGGPVETGSQPAAAGDSARSAPPPRMPPPPPRRPRREPPKPKLTQAALEGKVPLRTFGELSALFAAKKDKDAPPPAPAAPANVAAPTTSPPEPASAAPAAAVADTPAAAVAEASAPSATEALTPATVPPSPSDNS